MWKRIAKKLHIQLGSWIWRGSGLNCYFSYWNFNVINILYIKKERRKERLSPARFVPFTTLISLFLISMLDYNLLNFLYHVLLRYNIVTFFLKEKVNFQKQWYSSIRMTDMFFFLILMQLKNDQSNLNILEPANTINFLLSFFFSLDNILCLTWVIRKKSMIIRFLSRLYANLCWEMKFHIRKLSKKISIYKRLGTTILSA